MVCTECIFLMEVNIICNFNSQVKQCFSLRFSYVDLSKTCQGSCDGLNSCYWMIEERFSFKVWNLICFLKKINNRAIL